MHHMKFPGAWRSLGIPMGRVKKNLILVNVGNESFFMQFSKEILKIDLTNV